MSFNTAAHLHRLCHAIDRVAVLTEILTELQIPFELDRFRNNAGIDYVNVYVWGARQKFLCAHHDVLERASHNANDNTASLVNCIHALTLAPGLGCIFTDGEEPPHYGAGARRALAVVPNPRWIFNLDVTGKGSTWWIDDGRNRFSDAVYKKFKPLTTSTPFNDSVIFARAGIPTTVATLCEPHKHALGRPSMEVLHTLHSVADSIDTVSPADMDRFVREVLVPTFEEIDL